MATIHMPSFSGERGDHRSGMHELDSHQTGRSEFEVAMEVVQFKQASMIWVMTCDVVNLLEGVTSGDLTGCYQ